MCYTFVSSPLVRCAHVLREKENVKLGWLNVPGEYMRMGCAMGCAWNNESTSNKTVEA